MYKNYNIGRRYVLDSSFSRGTTNCSGYTGISASDHGGFNQHSKENIGSDIEFGVSRIITRFTEYDTKSAATEGGKDKKPMQRASREVTSNSQGTKQIE